ncbi:MAG: class I SAM-dependent methyltransferase [Promethearchaeota archaeon]
MTKKFLSLRYKNDGKSQVKLNYRQKQTVNKIKADLKNGILKWEYNKCLCTIDNDLTLGLKDRRGLQYRTVICKNCGLIRSNPRISSDSMDIFYDYYYRNLITPKYKQDEKHLLANTFEQEAEKAKGVLKFIEDKTILKEAMVFDFGAGTGGMVEVFKNAGFETFGVDLNENYLRFGLNRGLNLKKGSLDELKNYSRKANLIIASHILEHLPNLDITIKGLWECLEDNSFLCVILPGLFKVQDIYGSLQPYFVIEHLYYFTLSTLKKVIMRNGFKFIAGNEDIIAVFQKSSKSYNINISKEYLDNILLYLRINDVPLPLNANKTIKNKNKLKNKILISLISFLYLTKLINIFAILRTLLGKKLKSQNLISKLSWILSRIIRFF